MEKLIIIGSRESVYIKHLSSHFALEFYPNFYSFNGVVKAKILGINQSDKDAETFLEKHPQSSVLMVRGGEKSFSPTLTIVNTDYNHQYLDYNSFKTLIEILDSPPCDKGKSPLLYNPRLDCYTLPKRAYKQPMIPQDFLREQIELNAALLSGEIRRLEGLPKHEILCSLERINSDDDAIHFKKKVSFNFNAHFVQITSGDHYTFIAKVVYEDNELIIVEKAFVEGEKVVVFVSSSNQRLSLTLNSFKSIFKNCIITASYEQILKQYALMLESIENIKSDKGPLAYLAGLSSNYCSSWPNITNIKLSDKEKIILRDPEQAELLSLALSDISVLPITGGPGSGKTMLTAIIVKKLLENKMSVLCMAHSNYAVKALLEQISKFVDKSKIVVISNNPIFAKYTTKEIEFLSEKIKCPKEPMLVLCTIGSYYSHPYCQEIRKQETYFPVSIFDEASMLTMAECALPMKYTSKKCIFVGDADQLKGVPFNVFEMPELVNPDKLIAFQKTSMFEKMCGFLNYSKLLCNRRSLPVIIDYINKKFDKRMRYGRFDPNYSGEVKVVELTKGIERPVRTSYINHYQGQVVVKHLKDYIYQCKESGVSIKKASILIIAPYKEQVRKIIALLEKEKRLSPLFADIDISEILRIVNTASSFQGQEADLVIISLVRDNPEQNRGFIDPNLVYVAFTRAKNKLVVISSKRMKF